MSYYSEPVENQVREHHPSSPRTAADRLYDRALRDLFGRCVPGLIVLFAVAVSVTSFAEVANAIERATFWMWLIGFGAGWLTAFALLEIGRRFNLVLLGPDGATDEQYWTAEERFRAAASRRRRAEYERQVTVRDASAVASVSLFTSIAVLAVDFVVDVHLHQSPWSEIRNGATALLALVILGVALQMVHREYVKKAWRYLTFGRDERRDGRGA